MRIKLTRETYVRLPGGTEIEVSETEASRLCMLRVAERIEEPEKKPAKAPARKPTKRG